MSDRAVSLLSKRTSVFYRRVAQSGGSASRVAAYVHSSSVARRLSGTTVASRGNLLGSSCAVVTPADPTLKSMVRRHAHSVINRETLLRICNAKRHLDRYQARLKYVKYTYEKSWVSFPRDINQNPPAIALNARIIQASYLRSGEIARLDRRVCKSTSSRARARACEPTLPASAGLLSRACSRLNIRFKQTRVERNNAERQLQSRSYNNFPRGITLTRF